MSECQIEMKKIKVNQQLHPTINNFAAATISNRKDRRQSIYAQHQCRSEINNAPIDQIENNCD